MVTLSFPAASKKEAVSVLIEHNPSEVGVNIAEYNSLLVDLNSLMIPPTTWRSSATNPLTISLNVKVNIRL
jgi:hypothetical protein